MSKRVRKAVFPVAGLGTRLLPATKSIPKEMITIVDRSGQGSYMPNFDWGRGYGGWETNRLYIVSVGQGLFEVDLGVESKPRW